MFVTAIGFVMNVSTVITGMPASTARWIGAISALLSVGAIRIASGFLAIAAFRNGICVGGENASGEPGELHAHVAELLRLGLCALVHRQVEGVGRDPGDEDELVRLRGLLRGRRCAA